MFHCIFRSFKFKEDSFAQIYLNFRSRGRDFEKEKSHRFHRTRIELIFCLGSYFKLIPKGCKMIVEIKYFRSILVI